MKYKNKNPLEKLHEGEPYFFIRAQDKHSVRIVREYAKMLKNTGDIEGYKGVLDFSDNMVDWQEANQDKVKLPD